MTDTKRSTLPQAKLAGVLLLIWAAMNLSPLWRQITALKGLAKLKPTDLFGLALNLVLLAALILLGVALWKGSRGKDVLLGIRLLTGAYLGFFLNGFFTELYCKEEYHYSRYTGSTYTSHFSFWVFLPYLVRFLAYLCLFLFSHELLGGREEAKQAQVKKLWLLPGVLMAAQLPLAFLAFFFAGTTLTVPSGFVRFSLSCAVMLLAMLWFAFPEGMEDTGFQGDGYKGMIPHLLLCVFTLGIYQLIWISRMTKYLNARIDSEPPMTPWHQVVGCLFVPFYMTYWVYKTAQRLDTAAREQGVASSLTLPCILVKLVSPCNIILPSILIQDKVNAIALFSAGKALPGAPCVQNGPTWGGSAAPEAVPPADPMLLNPDQLPEL